MRAQSTNNRHYIAEYESGPCPTWMKSLEEKYKRLHMKIVFNASANRRRTRILSAASAGHSRNSRSLKRSQNLRPTPLHGPQTARLGQKTENKNKSILTQAFGNKGDETEVYEEKAEVPENGIARINVPGELSDIVSDNSSLSFEPDSEMKNSNTDKADHKHSRGMQSQRPKMNKLDTRPPAISRQEQILMREPTREELQKKSKLFQRMSKEAQTAIIEARDEKKRTLLNGRRESILLDSFRNNARSSKTDVYGVTLPLDSSKRERPKSCAAVYSLTSSSSEEADEKLVVHKDNRRLPEIISARTESTFKSAGQRNMLLPGVGKYKIPLLREQTFQVTGAEYDIRYREVIQTGRRDSITPPSDILEQAMIKCQEWLSKHYVVCSTSRR